MSSDNLNKPADPIQVADDNPLAVARSLPPDLLLIVFIHGFKGTDSSFGGFPARLQHILSETIKNVTVECIVFPAYETKGQLNQAVERFADWLTQLTVEREVANGAGGGAGKARIVLCGHSMGGLVAADTLVEIVNSRPDKKAPVWPNIIACLAYDTPYFGLHPFVFKNSATKAFEYAQAAHSVVTDVMGAFSYFGAKQTPNSADSAKAPVALLTGPPQSPSSSSTGWAKWAPAAYAVGGAVMAGAAAGTAYWRREDLGSGYSWASDHMKYVGNLWDDKILKLRVESLVEIERDLGVTFRTYYTYIPPQPPAHMTPRTFIVLPDSSSPYASHFFPTRNTLAEDEVQAHIGMFEASTNDGYYELGLETAMVIREGIMTGRGLVDDKGKEEVMEVEEKPAQEEPCERGENPWNSSP
ncbi:hypothetical protein JAAARDRAFT_118213 [Jaapia argillacea MUCL 33604]|uniref:AB hydrolase-1 domain-containing protein n=1 Tax=Jaapia argillacea MUCL 33604 TaxID=933084 RepID=A0A067QBA0_9AGAM|nr:hypothetical protein JAAARDRAFT_118213 [Jaapia argillacea MUCL 33604]